jgi:hypothetical protein
LYVEPKGHGILALNDEKQTTRKDALIYKFTGHADDPEGVEGTTIGYELLPISRTLWPRALDGETATYAEVQDFGDVAIRVRRADADDTELKVRLHKIGVAFAGKVGGINMARPPWGWFDRSRREETLGFWYFDPAKTIKRDFRLDEAFSTSYLQTPFWAMKATTEKTAAQ